MYGYWKGHGASCRISPVFWFVQGLFIFDCIQYVAYPEDEAVKTYEKIRCYLLGIVSVILLLSAVFPLLIIETHHCQSLDDATQEMLRECYQAVSSSVSADLAASCMTDTDISTRATGICPQIRFGKQTGTAWTVIGFLLFIHFLAGDVALLAYYLRKKIKR